MNRYFLVANRDKSFSNSDKNISNSLYATKKEPSAGTLAHFS